MREHLVRVRVTGEELRTLDVLAAERGQTRSDVARSAIRPGRSTGQASQPSRERALELLARAAEDGSVQAAAMLAREIRLGPKPLALEDDPFADVIDIVKRRRMR